MSDSNDQNSNLSECHDTVDTSLSESNVINLNDSNAPFSLQQLLAALQAQQANQQIQVKIYMSTLQVCSLEYLPVSMNVFYC